MDPYLGEIRMFAGNYAPQGWHFCDGSTLKISQYEALFSLLGTTWGGDGTTTFGIPDLRGRVPVGQGAGTSLTPRQLAQTGGASEVQLTQADMPSHSHAFFAVASSATTLAVTDGVALAEPNGHVGRYAPPATVPAPKPVEMGAGAVTTAPGGSQSHDNVMPYMAIQFIIALAGLYPQRP